MAQYDLLEGTQADLVKMINERLASGWCLHGETFQSSGDSHYAGIVDGKAVACYRAQRFSQAMIKVN